MSSNSTFLKEVESTGERWRFRIKCLRSQGHFSFSFLCLSALVQGFLQKLKIGVRKAVPCWLLSVGPSVPPTCSNNFSAPTSICYLTHCPTGVWEPPEQDGFVPQGPRESRKRSTPEVEDRRKGEAQEVGRWLPGPVIIPGHFRVSEKGRRQALRGE